MFLEAPENLIDKIYVAESMLDDEEVMEKVRRFSWESVENGVFRQMCDTQTPQGILTVLRQPSYQMQDLLKEKKSTDHGAGRSSGSGQRRNNHKNRRRRRSQRRFFLQRPVWIITNPKGDPCN